ncbi:hypothetical protein EST62_00785 [Chlorobaculum sp. 24CR]|uniref:hypothetical protein n=1 Tax=Chlorobaculum sp. 24CR TaxID=2508878 RepID=UPI00100A5F8D|nr:hypothetical protein [Chlorobaculum sp. 24CR]RXK89109.1 hypothetical protein EST62_00785 [Chlorobaculum sp. 24CR]
MKNFVSRTAGVALLSVMTVISGCSKSDNPVSDAVSSLSGESLPKRYEIKSGIVHYEPQKLMGMGTTTETLYFDDYGRKEAVERVTESNVMGIKTYEHTMQVTDGHTGISYEIKKTVNGKDETSKVATKSDLREFQEMAQAMAKSLDVNELKKNMDYREEGTETIAGVTGKKYSVAMNKELPDARVFGVMYKNIVLKSEMGSISMKAASIEENVAVPASKFEIPAGYTVQEVNVAEEMEKAASMGESNE